MYKYIDMTCNNMFMTQMLLSVWLRHTFWYPEEYNPDATKIAPTLIILIPSFLLYNSVVFKLTVLDVLKEIYTY